MLDKFRDFRGGFSAKTWVAYFLFGAIIIVFALWGVKSDQYGGTGGVAASVNDTSITLSEYRNAVEQSMQRVRQRLDQFPEAQRAAFQQQISGQALEQLIAAEVLYQAANKRGVIASDSEVRDQILEVPFFKDNGRFMKDRYQTFLQNYGMSSVQFERQIRKDLVNQKMQGLFVGSISPSTEELKRGQYLANQKINIRFVEFNREDLAKAFVTDNEVEEFLKTKKAEVEKYYKENTIEFTEKESVQTPLAAVQGKIARKLIAREKENSVLSQVKEKLSSGRAAVDQVVSKAGLKWTESGEFDLLSASVPKLGESPELMRVLVKKGKNPGLILDVVSIPGGRYVLAELISWKEAPAPKANVDALENMMVYRKSSEIIEKFIQDSMATASIKRNERLVKTSAN